jgi:hypothetical protein
MEDPRPYVEALAALLRAARIDPHGPAGARWLEVQRACLDAFRDQEPVLSALEALARNPGKDGRRGDLVDELREAGSPLLPALGSLVPEWLPGGTAGAQGSPGSAGSPATQASPLDPFVARDFVGTVYQGPVPRDATAALALFRRMLILGCRGLPLRGKEVGASDPEGRQNRIDLDKVYVDLDTTTRIVERPGAASAPTSASGPGLFTRVVSRPPRWLVARVGSTAKPEEHPGTSDSPPDRSGKERILGALEAVIAHRHVVLLGDPGSGKSTFANHLAVCLALHGLEPEHHWLDRLTDWPPAEGNLLPIVVILRDLARALPAGPAEIGCDALWDHVRAALKRRRLDALEPHLEAALEAGRAILLFDGLDEVPGTEARRKVRDLVAGCAERYADARVVVTCRTLSYQDPRWRLPREFESFTLAPFDDAKIDRFIDAWFGDLTRLQVVKEEAAGPMARALQQAVQRPDLRRLARNPLLLTVMALVHTHKGRLPDARALLYEEAVEILLWRWEQLKQEGVPEAVGLRERLQEVGRSDVDLKRLLWRLAFEAHRGTGADEKLADIGELELQRALRELHPDRKLGWVGEILDAVKLRAGLLLERVPGVYTFPHRTFQEYLAGAHLAGQAAFAREAAALVDGGVLWREVILLAVGRLVYLGGDTEKPLALVAELCPVEPSRSDGGWRRVALAGEVLHEIGVARARESELGRDLLRRVRARLRELLEAGALSAVERARAGVTLGHLGDEREGVGCVEVEGVRVPGFKWVEIGSGPFLMGSKGGEGGDAERPRFRCGLIERGYRVGKYPVTVEQYGCFVEGGGYRERRWWTGAGWAWREEERIEGPWISGRYIRRGIIRWWG